MAEAKKANGRDPMSVYRGREMSQPEANQIRAGGPRPAGQRRPYPLRLLTRRLRGHGRRLHAFRVGRGRQGPSPVRLLSARRPRTSGRRTAGRLPLDGPDDELKELCTTFNQLLDRLERSFESQRGFVANASHELRTPLTRQRAIAQVALSDPDATADSLRAARERVLAAGAQQERLLDALLTLARGEAGSGRPEALDLAAVVRSVLGQPPGRSPTSRCASSRPSPLHLLSGIPTWSSGWWRTWSTTRVATTSPVGRSGFPR